MRLLRSVPASAAAAAGLALAVSLPAPASAFVVGGGPGPCQSSTGTLTLSKQKVYPGVDVTATWSTSRPGGCGTVSELTGPNGYSAFGGVGGTAQFLPPGLGTWTYDVVADYPGGTLVVATASLTVTNSPHVPPVAFATPTGAADEVNDDTSGQVVPVPGLTVASGTSPVVGSDLDYGTRYIAAHAAGTDTLEYIDVAGGLHDSGVTMAPGSSPAIAPFGRSDAEIAFVGADTELRQLDAETGAISSPVAGRMLRVAPGTSPAIVGDTIAFHVYGDENTLWYVDDNGAAHDTGLQMAPGSSPAITTDLSEGLILFTRDTGFPAVYNTGTQAVTDYPAEAVAPNTGLAIQFMLNSNCGYEFTFVGADDALWREFSCSGAAPASTHIPVAPGTGPSMAALTSTFPSGFQTLVNNPATGTIWQYLGDGDQLDTHVPIEPGTTPSTSNATASPSTPTLFNIP